MKKLLFTFLAALFSPFIIAQASGNVNYQNQQYYNSNTINVNFPSNGDILVSVKVWRTLKQMFTPQFSAQHKLAKPLRKLMN